MQLPKGRISSLGQQFMPITQLKGLESGDFPGHTVEETHANATSGNAYDITSLRKDIGEHGLKDPLMVRDNTLMNGHHRASVAIDQGHMFVQHTPDHPKEWAPMTYRNRPSRDTPTRTWEPMIQEHEAAHAPAPQHPPQVEGQQQLFQTRFNDRRTHGA